jgi:hypothetical protein
MACDLTVGRQISCKDSVSGLKAVYFINDGDIDTNVGGEITYGSNGDTIATMTGSHHGFKYDLKGGSSFTQNIISSRESGTTYFEQVLELSIPGLTSADHKELKLLSFGNPSVIVEDNNSNFFLAGLEFGMDVTGGAIEIGANMGDSSGYKLTLTGMEKIPANYFDSTTEQALATACGFVMVQGGGTFVS